MKNKACTIGITFRVFVTLCAAWGWWGFLYPELTMTVDTYRVVTESGTVQETDEVIEWDFNKDIYKTVLRADGSRVRLRSRLLTNMTAFTEQGRGIHDSGN